MPSLLGRIFYVFLRHSRHTRESISFAGHIIGKSTSFCPHRLQLASSTFIVVPAYPRNLVLQAIMPKRKSKTLRSESEDSQPKLRKARLNSDGTEPQNGGNGKDVNASLQNKSDINSYVDCDSSLAVGVEKFCSAMLKCSAILKRSVEVKQDMSLGRTLKHSSNNNMSEFPPCTSKSEKPGKKSLHPFLAAGPSHSPSRVKLPLLVDLTEESEMSHHHKRKHPLSPNNGERKSGNRDKLGVLSVPKHLKKKHTSHKKKIYSVQASKHNSSMDDTDDISVICEYRSRKRTEEANKISPRKRPRIVGATSEIPCHSLSSPIRSSSSGIFQVTDKTKSDKSKVRKRGKVKEKCKSSSIAGTVEVVDIADEEIESIAPNGSFVADEIVTSLRAKKHNKIPPLSPKYTNNSDALVLPTRNGVKRKTRPISTGASIASDDEVIVESVNEQETLTAEKRKGTRKRSRESVMSNDEDKVSCEGNGKPEPDEIFVEDASGMDVMENKQKLPPPDNKEEEVYVRGIRPSMNLIEGEPVYCQSQPQNTLADEELLEESGVKIYNYAEEVKQQISNLKDIRKWEYSKLGSSFKESNFKTKDEEFIFTVASYNVLAQVLLQMHPDLYSEHDKRALVWDYRSRGLIKELEELDADILCLQEIQDDHVGPFYNVELQALGYKGIFKQRTNNKRDGCAIYYKMSRFNLVEYTTVEFYQPGIDILDRDNIGLVAKLEVKNRPQNYLCVSTTHLLYNPNRHDVKLAQTQVLLAEIDRLAYQGLDRNNVPKYIPVILTGDMNLEPFTGVYEFLTEGRFQYENTTNKRLFFYGPGRWLTKELVPKHLEVTDQCQHLSVVKKRKEDRKYYKHVDREEEIRELKLYNSDHQKTVQEFNNATPCYNSFQEFVEAMKIGSVNNFVQGFGTASVPSPSLSKDTAILEVGAMLQGASLSSPEWSFESGSLSHRFHFRSVYRHRQEATTRQDDWVTVDYIFYSTVWNQRFQKLIEGKLKLIGKYSLLKKSECETIGNIPNLASPSDHFPLVAKFLLKLTM